MKTGNEWQVGDVLFMCGSQQVGQHCSPHLFVAERLPASVGWSDGCYSANDRITRQATIEDADRMIGHQIHDVQREMDRLANLLQLREKITGLARQPGERLSDLQAIAEASKDPPTRTYDSFVIELLAKGRNDEESHDGLLPL